MLTPKFWETTHRPRLWSPSTSILASHRACRSCNKPNIVSLAKQSPANRPSRGVSDDIQLERSTVSYSHCRQGGWNPTRPATLRKALNPCWGSRQHAPKDKAVRAGPGPKPGGIAALSKRDRVYTLAGILLALFLGALDQTIVSTALPKIAEDLRGLDRFTWGATAYLLASTVLVPIYGKLADTYPRKTIELIAISIFLAGSFLCGLSGEFGGLPLLGDGMTQLILFRALQGVGGAGLFSLAFIIIADLFPPNIRGRYQGLLGATFGIASVVGPWVGGLLTDYGSNRQLSLRDK